MVTVAFGLAPGTLIGLIDRHRPYLAAAIAPAGFGLYVAAAYGIVGAMGRMPYFSWLVLLPTVVGPLATWLSAAAAIALVRAVRRS